MTKSNLREERLYLANISRSQSSLKEVRAGAQAWTEAEAVKECCLLTPFLIHVQLGLFYTFQTHLPRDGVAHIGLGPPTSLKNQGNLSQMWVQASVICEVFHLRFLVTLVFVKLTIKVNCILAFFFFDVLGIKFRAFHILGFTKYYCQHQHVLDLILRRMKLLDILYSWCWAGFQF